MQNESKIYELKLLFDGNQINLEDIKERASKIIEGLGIQPTLDFQVISDQIILSASSNSLEAIDECHVLITESIVVSHNLYCVRLVDDVGDYVRQQAYPILSRMEQKLRNFAHRVFLEVFGHDWWGKMVAKEQATKTEKVIAQSNIPGYHPLDFTTFDELISFVTGKNKQKITRDLNTNELVVLISTSKDLPDLKSKIKESTEELASFWDTTFARYFSDKEQWERAKIYLKTFILPERNKVMHHRPIRLSSIEALQKFELEFDKLINLAKPELSEVERNEAEHEIKEPFVVPQPESEPALNGLTDKDLSSEETTKLSSLIETVIPARMKEEYLRIHSYPPLDPSKSFVGSSYPPLDPSKNLSGLSSTLFDPSKSLSRFKNPANFRPPPNDLVQDVETNSSNPTEKEGKSGELNVVDGKTNEPTTLD